MLLKIISWNIRHFRQAKIDDYIHTLWEVCNHAHVVFIYEDHTGLGSTLADALNKFEKKSLKPAANWQGTEIRAMDEYVAVVWRGLVGVTKNGGSQAKLAALMSGERFPAVVDINANTGRTLTVAAWHAYGPAKVSAKDLFQRILTSEHCDILIGDFNFQTFNKGLPMGGLDADDSEFTSDISMDFAAAPSLVIDNTKRKSVGRRSDRLSQNQKMTEILPSNHTGSTTYTEEGIGKRTTGLDRCVVLSQHLPSVKLMVLQPAWHDEAITLTDHMPLLLGIDIA
jgi:hypothetical protein